jgi:hypothetical protein
MDRIITGPAILRGMQNSIDDLHNKMRGLARKDFQGLYLRLARVINIDYESYYCGVQYIGEATSAAEVPVASMAWGPRSGTVQLPEFGSLVIVGFIRWGVDQFRPVILSALPTSIKGGLREDPWLNLPGSKERRLRASKSYPGELKQTSTQGSNLILDKDVHLLNYRHDELGLRADDQAYLYKAVQMYGSTDAHKLLDGLVYRDDSIEIPPVTIPHINSHHKWLYVVTVDNAKYITKPIGYAVPWTENRVTFEEFGDGSPAVTEQHDNDPRDVKNPLWRRNRWEGSNYELIEEIYGTNVGNDPRVERERFGYVLVPQVWCNKEAVGDAGSQERPRLDEMSYIDIPDGKANIGNSWWVNEIPIDGDVPEKLQLGSAYRFRMRKAKSGLYYNAISKTGKVFTHLGQGGKLDPLGEGRSLEFSSEGSAKFVLGRNFDEGISVQSETRGGIKAHIGFTKQPNPRIYQLHLDSAAYGGHTVEGNKPESCVSDCSFFPVSTAGHGYHSNLANTAASAPKVGQIPSDPQNEGMSLDLNIDKNVHIIIGTDAGGAGDDKSLVVDTKGAFVFWLGKDSVNDDSIVGQTDGGVELVLGRDADNLRSIDMNCVGGIQIFNQQGDAPKNRSLEWKMARGMHWEVYAPDAETQALSMILNGNVTIAIKGNVMLNVDGNVTENVTQDRVFNVGGDFVIRSKGSFLRETLQDAVQVTAGNSGNISDI